MLRQPDSGRHARKLYQLLQKRGDRLRKQCRQPMTPECYHRHLQVAAACDAARETIAILYRRYNNQALEGENLNDDT
ncbi:hypothetical protein VL10_24165 [Leclercia adecarboxylata]|nr:hypothetical protein VL10_24165 [Leclercia adecarboxylata]KMN66766.1 hypothetical protein VK95_04605 [Leclercia sp. LK8]